MTKGYRRTLSLVSLQTSESHVQLRRITQKHGLIGRKVGKVKGMSLQHPIVLCQVLTLGQLILKFSSTVQGCSVVNIVRPVYQIQPPSGKLPHALGSCDGDVVPCCFGHDDGMFPKLLRNYSMHGPSACG